MKAKYLTALAKRQGYKCREARKYPACTIALVINWLAEADQKTPSMHYPCY